MASPIDKLVIQIEADTKQLKKELKQIEGKIRTTGATGGAAFGGMAGAMSKAKGGALLLTGALVGVGVGISKIAKVGAGFEDLKDSLDQVFGSIDAGDAAMQKVFKFAQTTPFQIEDATKAFISLKSAGIEPSMDMLQTFADTASVSVDQLGTFEALIRMVQRSASGGMGLEELNMISDRGIDVLGILGEKLNLSKDDVATFGKTAEGAAEMVRALTEGLNEKFGGAMEAKMDNLSTKTSNMTIAFKQMADEVFKSNLGEFLKDLADTLTNVANAIAENIRLMRGEASLDDLNLGHLDPEDQQMALTELIRRSEEKIDAFDKKMESRKEFSFSDAIAAGSGSFVGTGEGILEGFDIEEERKLFASYKRILKQLDKADDEYLRKREDKFTSDEFVAGSIDGLIEFQSTFKKLLEDTIPEAQKLQDQIDFIANLMATDDEKDKKGIMAFLGVKDEKELQKVIDHLGVLKGELVEVSQFSSEMQQTIVNASNAFTTDFVNSLLEGESALASFKDFAQSMVSQIIAIFLQMEVVNRILAEIFPNFQGQVGTGLFDQSASGGTVQKGRPTLVGERGAEIFVPHSGGTIMNNMNSRNAMGGGTTVINQSINFATGVVPTVRAEVMKMMPQIADVTKGAVAEAAMRGGNYRRALQGG
jgi:hypothetical protein